MTHTPPLGHLLPATAPRSFMLAYVLNGCLVGWDANGALVITSQQTGKKLVITRQELTDYANQRGLHQPDPLHNGADESWPTELNLEPNKEAAQ